MFKSNILGCFFNVHMNLNSIVRKLNYSKNLKTYCIRRMTSGGSDPRFSGFNLVIETQGTSIAVPLPGCIEISSKVSSILKVFFALRKLILVQSFSPSLKISLL